MFELDRHSHVHLSAYDPKRLQRDERPTTRMTAKECRPGDRNFKRILLQSLATNTIMRTLPLSKDHCSRRAQLTQLLQRATRHIGKLDRASREGLRSNKSLLVMHWTEAGATWMISSGSSLASRTR